MEAVLHLKSTVGERIAGVQKDLSSIAGFIQDYEEKQRLGKRTLLKKGLQFYEALLKFDGSQIMQAIDEEIEVVNQMADAEKEKKVKEA